MRYLSLLLVLILVACEPIVITPPSSTLDPTPTREIVTPIATATNPPIVMHCETSSTQDGFMPINFNPCLVGRNFIQLQDGIQWCIADDFALNGSPYNVIWQSRNSSPPPFVFCEANGGMKVDLANRAGRFGLRLGLDYLIPNACYLLKISSTSDINRSATSSDPNRYSLANFRFAGRIGYNDRWSDFASQSPELEDAYKEYVWAFTSSRQDVVIETWMELLWADYSGVMIWHSLEVFEVPSDYCNNGIQF